MKHLPCTDTEQLIHSPSGSHCSLGWPRKSGDPARKDPCGKRCPRFPVPVSGLLIMPFHDGAQLMQCNMQRHYRFQYYGQSRRPPPRSNQTLSCSWLNQTGVRKVGRRVQNFRDASLEQVKLARVSALHRKPLYALKYFGAILAPQKSRNYFRSE
jgi:hypothetical protein